jgi:hypothetical protein
MLRVTPLVLAALLVLAACADPSANAPSPPPGTGTPPPATRADLLGAHVCRATGGSDAMFRWEFRDADFTLSREGGSIPPEVLAAIAGRKDDAVRIDGKWKLDGPSLLLSGLLVHFDDDRVGPVPDVKLAPFCTPVVRIEFGETQYVLGPAR